MKAKQIQMSCNFLLLNAKVTCIYINVSVCVCACVHVIVLVGAEVGGNDIKSRSRAFDDGLLAHTKRLILQTT